MKKTFQKAKKSNTDPNMALLCLWSTPIDSQLPSPSELLFGRQVQDTLPRKAKKNASRDVILRLQGRQAKQKYYFDRSTKSLPNLGPRLGCDDPKSEKFKMGTGRGRRQDRGNFTVV